LTGSGPAERRACTGENDAAKQAPALRIGWRCIGRRGRFFGGFFRHRIDRQF
jgi:hypothetical protein